jgi:hypothetical protein
LRKQLDIASKRFPAVDLEEKAKLVAVLLLARPLKAANPDALHPGKAGKIPRGKRAFPNGIIPRLS